MFSLYYEKRINSINKNVMEDVDMIRKFNKPTPEEI